MMEFTSKYTISKSNRITSIYIDCLKIVDELVPQINIVR